MIECTVRLIAKPGTFQPTSFTEWIGHLIDVTGLDPAYNHVLKAVENTEDGTTSTLTVNTYRDDSPDLAANMSVRWDTPTAEIRAHLDGEHLATGRLDVPLQPGQTIRLGDQLYNVTDAHHPARQDDGTTIGDDYQHVELVPIPDQPLVRDLGVAGGILGLLGGM